MHLEICGRPPWNSAGILPLASFHSHRFWQCNGQRIAWRHLQWQWAFLATNYRHSLQSRVFVCFLVYFHMHVLLFILLFVPLLYPLLLTLWHVRLLACFFQYQAKRLTWENVSEMTYFVSSGTSNHNSINQSYGCISIVCFWVVLYVLRQKLCVHTCVTGRRHASIFLLSTSSFRYY